ncbi:alginate lyase family protein [candidate division KSB1 bacterium]|nr:alginate lyase family protein [candidate division KSB1 bacterium]
MNILDDERRITDLDFFAHLRSDLPALADVHHALKKTGLADAREMFVEYFLKRKEPRWYFDWRFRKEPVTEFWDRSHTWGTPQLVPHEKRIQSLMQDVFTDSSGKKHDISDMTRMDPLVLRHGEKGQHIAMFIWASDLGEMYARTHDERYPQKLIRLLREYDRAFPRKVTEFDPDSPWLERTDLPWWHLMFIGKAVHNMLITLYTGILHHPVVQPDDIFLFFKKLWFYAAQFTRFTRKGEYRHFNHHWYEWGTCPFMFGQMFPEFKGFSDMRDWGREVINMHLERDFFDDGTYLEHSTCYNAGTLGINLLIPWAVAAANNIPLVESNNIARVRSWLGWVAGMTRPDGVLPSIGDEFDKYAMNTLARSAALLKEPALKGVAQIALNTLKKLDSPARAFGFPEFGIEECLRAKWDKLPAVDPEFTSAVFPDGGWVVLRDGWDEKSMYLALSAINPPLGKNHGHWDLLSFLAFARGHSFITDPASWIYNGYYTAERRGYLYSMESHNVLTIDDDPLISKRDLYPIWTGEVPKCTIEEYHLGEKIDFVSAWHDGYAPQRHTREILFVKNNYWLIIDHISNPDSDWLHTYRRRLHFDFDVAVEAGNSQLLARAGDSTLTIMPLPSDEPQIRMWRDDFLEPERQKLGFSSFPWVAEIRSESSGPVVLAMLIFPQSAGLDAAPLKFRCLEVIKDCVRIPSWKAIALEIETPNSRDFYYRAFENPGSSRFGNCETSERIWLRREPINAAPESIAINTGRK